MVPQVPESLELLQRYPWTAAGFPCTSPVLKFLVMTEYAADRFLQAGISALGICAQGGEVALYLPDSVSLRIDERLLQNLEVHEEAKALQILAQHVLLIPRGEGTEPVLAPTRPTEGEGAHSIAGVRHDGLGDAPIVNRPGRL